MLDMPSDFLDHDVMVVRSDHVVLLREWQWDRVGHARGPGPGGGRRATRGSWAGFVSAGTRADAASDAAALGAWSGRCRSPGVKRPRPRTNPKRVGERERKGGGKRSRGRQRKRDRKNRGQREVQPPGLRGWGIDAQEARNGRGTETSGTGRRDGWRPGGPRAFGEDRRGRYKCLPGTRRAGVGPVGLKIRYLDPSPVLP